MRNNLDPPEPFEPDPAQLAEIDFDPDGPVREPDDLDLARMREEAAVEEAAEAARFLTRYRRELRPLCDVAVCGFGRPGRQVAGVYAYDGVVWLWVEGLRTRRVGDLPGHVATPPRAIRLRSDDEAPDPPGRATSPPLDVPVTCPCCRRTQVVRYWSTDRIEVFPRSAIGLPEGHNAD